MYFNLGDSDLFKKAFKVVTCWQAALGSNQEILNTEVSVGDMYKKCERRVQVTRR